MLLFLSINIGTSAFFSVLYQFSPDYFQTHCINKKSPEKHCNGKCHLKKMIAVTEHTSDKSESTFVDLNISFDYLISNLPHVPKKLKKTVEIEQNTISNHYSFLFTPSLKAPPRA